MEEIAANKCFGGWHRRVRHRSAALGCDMAFAIFLPPAATPEAPAPALYWLSGLTCTDENFMQKAGAQRVAAELGLALVAPDTSPRGDGVPGDPDGAWDFGKGAGFYVDATQLPWAAHYRMHDYVSNELPELVEAAFPVSERRSIFGHSMGGHGALVCALRHPGRYRSVSAFSPIASPMSCPWGEKAFLRYLGPDRTAWRQWDSCELLARARQPLTLLVDVGEDDPFLDSQLKPALLARAAQAGGHALTLRRHDGYDHSYYFVATFMEDHLRHHARALAPGV